jgi:PadR family transcriptional regulator AphA
MINNIILGLLSKKKLTTYDIKLAMDKSISKFYSSSFGSINPAIKKLEKNKMISCSQIIENNRLKKIYQITQKGKENYNSWIKEPIKQGRLKDEVLIRIFFLADSDKGQQKKLIQDYIGEFNSSKIELEQTKEEIETIKLTPQQKNKIKYQIATLQFGIDYIKFKELWFQNLLADL